MSKDYAHIVKIPQHDFPEVGSIIEIAFARHAVVKAKVLRHSRLVVNLEVVCYPLPWLDNPKPGKRVTVPFHAIHWWEVIHPPPAKLKIEDDLR